MNEIYILNEDSPIVLTGNPNTLHSSISHQYPSILSKSTSSVASPPPSTDAFDGAAAERRLREAEDRLREVIEELQPRQRRAKMLHPPCDHADESCYPSILQLLTSRNRLRQSIQGV
ncbi:hypothetical protein LXL04_012852 [Taraxacum kok-saghyz]